MPTYRVVGGDFTRMQPITTYWKTTTNVKRQDLRHTTPAQTVYPEGSELTDVTEAELSAFPDRFELVEA